MAILESDHALLDLLQTQIPFVPRPFERIARQIGLSEDTVIARLCALRHPPAPERPVIRQISAIFDSKSLGYQTTLVAAKLDEARIDQAAAIINRHPGVSHNYRRNHAFNLWYTLAVPPDSQLGLEKTLAILHQQSGAISTRMLPTLRLFKIGVKFDLSGDAIEADAKSPTGFMPAISEHPPAPSAQDRALVRVLQQDLPLVKEPFASWADQAQMGVSQLLGKAQDFLDRKWMRRFAAVLKHREAGISANAMGVWAVPPETQEAFGQLAAGFAAVSHCYLRTSYPDWPYTIFTMVHGKTREQCEAVLAKISEQSDITDYSALYSSVEYKKVRVKYFTPEIEEWEKAAMGG